MKKFLLLSLLILSLPLLSFAIYNHQEFQYFSIADSGFDADYGDYDSGGSWGGGSNDDYYGGSSGSGSSSGSSSSGSNLNHVSAGSLSTEEAVCVIFIVIFILTLGVSICWLPDIIRNNKKKKRKINIPTQYRIKNILFTNYRLQPGEGENLKLIQSSYNNYVEIQKAWMNRDLTPIKHLLTDEMFNMYQMQVNTLVEDNQINVMSDFEFVCGGVSSITANKNFETLKIILCVNCKDYIKNANNNKVISGNKNAKLTYIYELTFVRDTNAKKKTNCPTCGAKVKNQMSTTCPYCNNNLLLTSSNLTLSNKKILYQFKH